MFCGKPSSLFSTKSGIVRQAVYLCGVQMTKNKQTTLIQSTKWRATYPISPYIIVVAC